MLKKIIFIFGICFFMFSCAITFPNTIRYAKITEKELNTTEIIGFLEIEFYAPNTNDKQTLMRKAYNALLNIAEKRFDGKLYIRNIKIREGFNIGLLGSHDIKYHAEGIVIREKEINANNE